MAVLSVPLRGAEVDTSYSTCRLTFNSLFNSGCAESPQLSYVNSANDASSSKLLKRLRMDFHYRGGFFRSSAAGCGTDGAGDAKLVASSFGAGVCGLYG